MLFEFILKPLDEVARWGTARDSLHWFGSTDGEYWIQAGEHALLGNAFAPR